MLYVWGVASAPVPGAAASAFTKAQSTDVYDMLKPNNPPRKDAFLKRQVLTADDAFTRSLSRDAFGLTQPNAPAPQYRYDMPKANN
jgi:hypothetical protein